MVSFLEQAEAELARRQGQGSDFLQRAEAELARRTQRQAPQAEITSAEAFGRSALNRTFDNLLNLPEAALQGLLKLGASELPDVSGRIPDPLEALIGGIRTLSGGAVDPQASAQRMSETRILPRGEDVRAGLRALTGGGMEAGREAEQDADIRFREAAPFATSAGEFAGDAASLLTARAPVSSALRGFSTPAARVATGPTGTLAREFKDWVSSSWFQGLERGFRRAAETGLDGALVAAMREGDPVSNAAVAAGSQAAGSLSLFLAKHPVRALTPTVLSTMFAIQMMKQATPGITQNIFESLDKSIGKVIAAMGVGAFSGIAGMGRLPRSTAENLGRIGDMITPALRTPMLSVFNDLTKGGRDNRPALQVLERYTEDPQFFTPSERRRIERAINNPKIDVTETVSRLMEDRRFRLKFESLNQ